MKIVYLSFVMCGGASSDCSLACLTKSCVLLLQLAGPGGERRGGVHRHNGGGDHHAGDDARRPAREGHGLLLDVHALRDPPGHDPRRLRLDHPLPRSQPGATQLQKLGEKQHDRHCFEPYFGQKHG